MSAFLSSSREYTICFLLRCCTFLYEQHVFSFTAKKRACQSRSESVQDTDTNLSVRHARVPCLGVVFISIELRKLTGTAILSPKEQLNGVDFLLPSRAKLRQRDRICAT